MGDAQQEKEDAYIEKQREKNELKLKLQARLLSGFLAHFTSVRSFGHTALAKMILFLLLYARLEASTN